MLLGPPVGSWVVLGWGLWAPSEPLFAALEWSWVILGFSEAGLSGSWALLIPGWSPGRRNPEGPEKRAFSCLYSLTVYTQLENNSFQSYVFFFYVLFLCAFLMCFPLPINLKLYCLKLSAN